MDALWDNESKLERESDGFAGLPRVNRPEKMKGFERF
jgi:hypothetical protein